MHFWSFFVAVAHHLVKVVDANGGKVEGEEGNTKKWIEQRRRYTHIRRLLLAQQRVEYEECTSIVHSFEQCYQHQEPPAYRL